MTVQQLIEKLNTLPQDAIATYEDNGELYEVEWAAYLNDKQNEYHKEYYNESGDKKILKSSNLVLIF